MDWFNENVIFISGPKYGVCVYLHFVKWFVPSRKLRVSFGLVGRRWFSYDWEPSNPFRRV